jgi:DNA-binding transcriptional ArsR family regulator
MAAESVDPIAALGEPRRREILDLVCEGERSVGDLVGRLGLSQPAVSQHLRVLLDAGLVRVRPEGRQRFYRASTEGLEAVRTEVERYWRAALAQAKRDLEEQRAKGRSR